MKKNEGNGSGYWTRITPGYDTHNQTGRAGLNRQARQIARDVEGAGRILDVGAGTGNAALAAARTGSFVAAVDLTPEMLAAARTKAVRQGMDNIGFSVQDAFSLGFPDRAFDAAIVSNLLHVVDDPSLVLREINRVLTRGGRLVAPTYLHGHSLFTRGRSLFCQLRGLPVRNRFSARQLGALVRGAGFSIIGQATISGVFPISHVVAEKTG